MFYYVLLALASQRREGTDRSFFMYITSFLVSLFSFLFNYRVAYNTPSFKMYKLSKVCLIAELLECIFIANLYIKIIVHQYFPLSQYFHSHVHTFKL